MPPTRRRALTTIVSAVGAYTSIGIAKAQSEVPDFDYLNGVDGGVEDLRGQEEVTVLTGADGNGGDLAFKPAGIWIDAGTTVTWEATGKGGRHSVETVNGPAQLENYPSGEESEQHDLLDEGDTYEFEFTEEHEGITNYHCGQHSEFDHKGAVAVGDDVPTVEQTSTDSSDGEETLDDGERPSNGTSETVPGFGAVGAVGAIGGGVYYLKERVVDDEKEK